MSTVPYEQQKIQTSNLIITQEAGWRYGIMSTVLTAKVTDKYSYYYTGGRFDEPSISCDVYGS